MDDETDAVVTAARQQMSRQWVPNRFIDLLEAGEVPKGHLRTLAGELYRLVGSDRRSFALLASRFPSPPAGDLFLAMAQGESQALRLLLDFASALGMDEADLTAYEPRPLAQAYPAYLTQTALHGTRSDIALALLANAAESGDQYTRVADALCKRYGFDEQAVGHFRFFADTPQELLDQAAETLRTGLAAGDDSAEAVRTARMVHAYEAAFWRALSEDIVRGRRSADQTRTAENR
ncbi:transcriptional regulator [Streptomyces sp. NPDC012510]|jgi:thiaminase|uniref:transcriptional regulator n=1 Tax=Streptomyces sp. NPDC012510 TaxID=3364838 RepID=UPI0036F07A3D